VFGSRLHSAIASELVATRQAALDERDQALKGYAELDSLRDELRVTRGELRMAIPRLASVEAELDDTKDQLRQSWDNVREMRKTLSWRVTSPLRQLRRWR